MPYIKTEPVESSNIDEIGYDRKKRTLRIVFHGGRVYDYPDVMERVYKELMEAESKGKHFIRRIKPVYMYRSVTRPEELKEPCCNHPERDTCDETCYPCDEWCCPGPPPTQAVDADGGAIASCIDCGTQCDACIASLDCPHGEADQDCEEGCVCYCHKAVETTETTALPSLEVHVPDPPLTQEEAERDMPPCPGDPGRHVEDCVSTSPPEEDSEAEEEDDGSQA